jgi:integrase
MCRESGLNENGMRSIEIDVVVNGKRVITALPKQASPQQFKNSMTEVGRNEIKDFCDYWENRARKAVKAMAEQCEETNTKNFRKYIFNVNSEKGTTLAKAWELIIKRRTADINDCAREKWYTAMKHSLEYFKPKQKIETLTPEQVEDYYHHLKSTFTINYAYKLMVYFKSMLIYNGVSPTIYRDLRLKTVEIDVEYLTKQEVNRIATHRFSNDTDTEVRDLFIFQCYTGMSYCDTQQLHASDILTSPAGQKFISRFRQKTKVRYTILLLPQALQILEKYGYELPKISNQKMNDHLKVIAKACEITKPLHSHIGRHTAATLFLNAGLSIDIVANILGHSTNRITRHYAKMLGGTVLKAMSQINI